jgi:hypothetical protein
LGLHPEARLTDDQRNLIIDWTQAQMDALKNQYPADSLKMPKRKCTPSFQIKKMASVREQKDCQLNDIWWIAIISWLNFKRGVITFKAR